MRPRWVVIVINGILAWPGSSKGWTDRAVTWIMQHAPAWGTVLSEKYEYWRGVLFRWWGRQGLVDDISDLMSGYHANGFARVCIVAHSNGCDLALRAVRDTGARGVVLHLVAGAADPDFESNGLNRLIENGTVARVHWWRCGRDVALNYLAPATRFITRIAGFQSGGSIQDESVYRIDQSVRPRVAFHDYPELGHSDLLSPERLPKTLTKILDHLSTEAA